MPSPGTFAGMREKIPYLKELGVNCVELMPIFEFDEFENSRGTRRTGELADELLGLQHRRLLRPKAGFAATGDATACRSTN